MFLYSNWTSLWKKVSNPPSAASYPETQTTECLRKKDMREKRDFPLPEEMTFQILGHLSTEDLLKLGPICKQLERIKKDILKKRPIEILGIKILHLSNKVVKTKKNNIAPDFTKILDQIPTYQEQIKSVDLNSISKSMFEKKNSPVIQGVEQLNRVYLSLLTKKRNNEEEVIITLYQRYQPEETSQKCCFYSNPAGEFGGKNPKTKTLKHVADAEILKQISQILRNCHPQFKLVKPHQNKGS